MRVALGLDREAEPAVTRERVEQVAEEAIGHRHPHVSSLQIEPDLDARLAGRSLELAARHSLRAVAFPGISTGVYGYPADRAAEIAIDTVLAFLRESPLPERVLLCAFSRAAAEISRAILSARTAPST